MSTTGVPGDVVAGILSRLPVKALLRFRCASKDWCTLIDGPYFIKLHLNRSIATNSDVSLIFEIGFPGRTLHSVDLDDSLISCDKAVTILTPFTKDAGDWIQLLCSCNGLLLCLVRGHARPTLLLCNPKTRQHCVLPYVPASYRHATPNSVEDDFLFGYDSINDDYKVFNAAVPRRIYPDDYNAAERNPNRCSPPTTYETRVYSLKSNSWRRSENFDFGCFEEWGAYTYGAFHRVNDPYFFASITAFDIGTEDFKHFPLPITGFHNRDQRPYSDDPGYNNVKVFGGYLCFLSEPSQYRPQSFSPDWRTRIDIWVMKEYGVKESWTVLHSVWVEPWLGCMRPLRSYSTTTECAAAAAAASMMKYSSS